MLLSLSIYSQCNVMYSIWINCTKYVFLYKLISAIYVYMLCHNVLCYCLCAHISFFPLYKGLKYKGHNIYFILHILYALKLWETASIAHLQVFFDLMREIRSRKIEDKSASNGRGKDRAKRKKKKCIIL